jgi:hypothetical protein
MLQDCSECDRLWAAYVQVRREHLRIKGSLQAAVDTRTTPPLEAAMPSGPDPG